MMYIKMNVSSDKDITATPGKNLAQGYPPEYANEFARYLTKILKKEYKKAIDKQRYSYKWAPLSVSYLQYKKVHNLSLKTWEATGLLYKSIIYRQRNGYYMIGIDPRARYKNGPLVLDVAKCMEYGTSKMTARPLFRPLFEYMRKNVGLYWKKFLHDEKGIDI